MAVSIVHAALPIEYPWDCPYIQLIFHGKLLVGTVSYMFQDTVKIQWFSKFDHCMFTVS